MNKKEESSRVMITEPKDILSCLVMPSKGRYIWFIKAVISSIGSLISVCIPFQWWLILNSSLNNYVLWQTDEINCLQYCSDLFWNVLVLVRPLKLQTWRVVHVFWKHFKRFSALDVVGEYIFFISLLQFCL